MRPETLPLILLLGLAGCQSTPTPDECGERPQSGRGEKSLERWYFDESALECRPFLWGGDEDGNVPFDSREDCEQHCLPGDNGGH